MPYVNIKVTKEGVSSDQKRQLIAGVTKLLESTLGKAPSTTFVVIEQVDLDSWGIGGLPVPEYRDKLASREL